MLYVFRVRGAPYVKMGFTASCPWRRIAQGFWSNLHPTECCGKLAWEDLELLALFAGDEAQEAALKQKLPPVRGEFWHESLEQALLAAMRALLPELPLPPRPETAPEVEHREERLPCCGAPQFKCCQCGRAFDRGHYLRQHLESHRQKKVSCRCGALVIKRNLVRHQKTCKGC